MTNAAQITIADVAQAAHEQGVGMFQAINMMQAACAKLGDEQTLARLCEIKSEILFGDD